MEMTSLVCCAFGSPGQASRAPSLGTTLGKCTNSTRKGGHWASTLRGARGSTCVLAGGTHTPMQLPETAQGVLPFPCRAQSVVGCGMACHRFPPAGISRHTCSTRTASTSQGMVRTVTRTVTTGSRDAWMVRARPCCMQLIDLALTQPPRTALQH
jgi:hypothetical protein